VDRSSKPVVPKLVRTITQMKVAIMSYYPQYFSLQKKQPVITQNNIVVFIPRYPRKICILLPVWEPLI